MVEKEVAQTPHRLFPTESPDLSTALCTTALPSPGTDILGGVGLVLGQDVAIQGDGKIFSPIIVEALVPGECDPSFLKNRFLFLQSNHYVGGSADGSGLIRVNDLLQEVIIIVTDVVEVQ